MDSQHPLTIHFYVTAFNEACDSELPNILPTNARPAKHGSWWRSDVVENSAASQSILLDGWKECEKVSTNDDRFKSEDSQLSLWT